MKAAWALALIAISALSPSAYAQGGQPYEQTYLAAGHNWAFRDHYPQADRLFNAFDYGHAILAEALLTRRGAAADRTVDQEFTFITDHLLRHPPALALAERAIDPTFSRLAPELEAIFSWAHMLHRQIYDIWADERIAPAHKDAAVAEAVRYYLSRHHLALDTRLKGMLLMDGQPYSGAFRSRDPKFNGLLWSYHWLQLALYDVLITAPTPEDKRAGVTSMMQRFYAMLDGAPDHFPDAMPFSETVAPVFAARYPEAAAIFDNLHALHDVVSDILVSPLVPPHDKRAALIAAAAAYRNVSDGESVARSHKPL